MKLRRSTPKRLIDRCWDIAEQCSDTTGFVSLRRLAEYCRCQVVPRPLLVEAAITKRTDGSDDWIALLNNEVHVFSDEDFELESSISHLAIRTRNTLAHEIAHAVAWDTLGHDFSNGGTHDERLSYIEKSVEVVSPLLLIPRSALALRLSQIRSPKESARKLVEIISHFAVSPGVFFNVLALFNRYYRAQFLLFEGILEALWGIAEMRGKRKFCISPSRLLPNFFKGQPHPANRFILSRGASEWRINRIEEIEGSFICFSSADEFDSGETEVGFEFARVPARKGQLIPFRLSASLNKR